MANTNPIFPDALPADGITAQLSHGTMSLDEFVEIFERHRPLAHSEEVRAYMDLVIAHPAVWESLAVLMEKIRADKAIVRAASGDFAARIQRRLEHRAALLSVVHESFNEK